MNAVETLALKERHLKNRTIYVAPLALYYRDDLPALGCHPMLVYVAPLVLSNFPLRSMFSSVPIKYGSLKITP